MGRYGGRHAHRNAGRAVGQQVRKARRQHRGLIVGAVIGGAEVDRILVDAVQQHHRRYRQLGLGVAHGRSIIAVDVAEIALAVHQRIALGKGLGHAHQGVIDRLVAVRVIAAHHLADHLGAFAGRVLRVQPHLAHGVEHAALHRFEAITHIRQRAVGDDAERIGQIPPAEGLGQRFIDDAVAGGWWGGRGGHAPMVVSGDAPVDGVRPSACHQQ